MNRTWRLAPVAALVAASMAASCSTCVTPPPPPHLPIVDIPHAVAVHDTTQLSAEEAEAIVTKASAILQTQDSPADVPCDVKLSIESLRRFTTGDGVVDSPFAYYRLFPPWNSNLTGAAANAPRTRQVRVVSEIRWCGAIIASAAGCADQGGWRIAVARRPEAIEGELWAHETGHTKDLIHRNSWVAVMHESILPDHAELTAGECTSYRR